MVVAINSGGGVLLKAPGPEHGNMINSQHGAWPWVAINLI